uniref:Uncharacterized protein n=1 Tax=Rhizophora mucronata TaxID=61149 RepID=A0A2P2PNV3_RHIMU
MNLIIINLSQAKLSIEEKAPTVK